MRGADVDVDVDVEVEVEVEGRSTSIISVSEKLKAPYPYGYYGICTVGGMLSAGTTHLAITPLDVLKVNMQVSLSFSWNILCLNSSLIFIYVPQNNYRDPISVLL